MSASASTGQTREDAARTVSGTPRAIRAARRIVTAPIVAYQRLLSPLLPPRCKYEPSCSRYAVEAIHTYGILKGAALAAWRLLRCNPWSYGGYDPVESQRWFGSPAATVATEHGPGPHKHARLGTEH